MICHPHWAIPTCKESFTHSNSEHYKTSRSFAKTTLRIIKQVGAPSQQCCKSQNEQEHHHSNVANHKTSRSCITATLQITKQSRQFLFVNVFVTFTLVPSSCFRIEKQWSGHIQNVSRCEHGQEPHHSNVANPKTNKSCTQEHCESQKRAGGSPQQHYEMTNERELHHSNTVNYKTNKSFTTTRL